MAMFLFIPGGWHGGWTFSGFAARLRQAGHEVWTPTLSGLEENSRQASGAINLTTHIGDVLELLAVEDLRVQFWTGGETNPRRAAMGLWQTFPSGTVNDGHGGSVTLPLTTFQTPTVRYIRVLMTVSSTPATRTARAIAATASATRSTSFRSGRSRKMGNFTTS